MKEIKLGVSPLTNQIYAGHLDKKGEAWLEKQDVTMNALLAVVEHCLNFGKPVVIQKENGKPEFEITVKDLRNEQQ